MPGKRSNSKTMQFVGILVTGIAVFGYFVFDWRFGEGNGLTPFTIGAVVAIFAVGFTLYQRISSSD